MTIAAVPENPMISPTAKDSIFSGLLTSDPAYLIVTNVTKKQYVRIIETVAINLPLVSFSMIFPIIALTFISSEALLHPAQHHAGD